RSASAPSCRSRGSSGGGTAGVCFSRWSSAGRVFLPMFDPLSQGWGDRSSRLLKAPSREIARSPQRGEARSSEALTTFIVGGTIATGLKPREARYGPENVRRNSALRGAALARLAAPPG